MTSLERDLKEKLFKFYNTCENYFTFTNEKIEKTGFKPRYSLPDGIRELIKGYQIIRKNQLSNI